MSKETNQFPSFFLINKLKKLALKNEINFFLFDSLVYSVQQLLNFSQDLSLFI